MVASFGKKSICICMHFCFFELQHTFPPILVFFGIVTWIHRHPEVRPSQFLLGGERLESRPRRSKISERCAQSKGGVFKYAFESNLEYFLLFGELWLQVLARG